MSYFCLYAVARLAKSVEAISLGKRTTLFLRLPAQERIDHASIQITLDTYSHVAPGLQEAAAESFDNLVSPKYNVTYQMSLSKSIISKLLAKMIFVRS